jgi:hypothetical protein
MGWDLDLHGSMVEWFGYDLGDGSVSGLETRDTAGWETCATGAAGQRRVVHEGFWD